MISKKIKVRGSGTRDHCLEKKKKRGEEEQMINGFLYTPPPTKTFRGPREENQQQEEVLAVKRERHCITKDLEKSGGGETISKRNTCEKPKENTSAK